MAIKFNIVERGNPSDPDAPKKYYPSIQSSGRVTTRELAEMAADRSTLTTVDMLAALESLLAIIPELLTSGNIVELGEFGSFWLRSTSEGIASARDVRASQIQTLLPRFHPGKRFKAVLKATTYVRGRRVRESAAEPEA
jgi:predicted histone-like DNA-binding protein